MNGFSFGEVVITCECGGRTTVANPAKLDAITCGACGRKVAIGRRTMEETESREVESSQASQTMTIPEKVAVAVQLVREEKYEEAARIYESVLKERLDHRDAFYGLGFCHYKRQNYKESLRLLNMAAQMGHSGAERLLNKVRGLVPTEI